MSWFKEWFNTPYYHILYKDRDFVEAENFIRNLTQDLQLSKDSKIIDLACGKGRHSVFLQQLGYEVLGVDLSEESIEHNKQFETSADETPKLTFEVHDMRNELYPNVSSEKVNAVFNLFTSFGYFDDDEDDRKVFSSVKNVLQIDGIFVLDFLNEKFEIIRDITVHDKRGNDFTYLNELEYVNGKIISNVWLTNKILIINPTDGVIERIVDMSLLTRFEDKFANRNKDVLNGIAYDAKNKK